MSANFRTVLFSGIAVVVGLGVGWWFFRAPSSVGKGKYLLQLWKPLGDGDTSSPIIISDGTIKFRQDDGWTANSATQLVVDLAGFVPLHIKFLACDKNGANCDSAVAFAQDVSKRTTGPLIFARRQAVNRGMSQPRCHGTKDRPKHHYRLCSGRVHFQQ